VCPDKRSPYKNLRINAPPDKCSPDKTLTHDLPPLKKNAPFPIRLSLVFCNSLSSTYYMFVIIDVARIFSVGACFFPPKVDDLFLVLDLNIHRLKLLN